MSTSIPGPSSPSLSARAVSPPRDLSAEELQRIAHYSNQAIPPLFPRLSDPLETLHSSPDKAGLLVGLALAIPFVLVGLSGGTLMRDPRLGSRGFGASFGALSVLIGLIAGGVTGGITRAAVRRRNDDFTDVMKRHPPGATYRDYVGDPDIQNRAYLDALAYAPHYHHRSRYRT